MTPAAFKRSIRDLQVWCSSCMVAFAGAEPIGVLIGAKRPSATLVHTIAVHPDHCRQGHGHHLLTSLSSKLAILGPPRIVAEVPDTNAAAAALFAGSGYVQEAVLTDYVLEAGQMPGLGTRGSGLDLNSDALEAPQRLVIPVTVDDLAANGLLGEVHQQRCWSRSAETITARKEDVSGFAVASDERIEAHVIYIKDEAILSLGTHVDDGGARLRQLLSRLSASGAGARLLPRVHPSEISAPLLESLGFRPSGGYRLFAARAASN
jgi:hypothetical protein